MPIPYAFSGESAFSPSTFEIKSKLQNYLIDLKSDSRLAISKVEPNIESTRQGKANAKVTLPGMRLVLHFLSFFMVKIKREKHNKTFHAYFIT